MIDYLNALRKSGATPMKISHILRQYVKKKKLWQNKKRRDILPFSIDKLMFVCYNKITNSSSPYEFAEET